MTFLPNIPQGADFLDFSWTQLLSNNQGLDAIFGIDHYAFSNLTANKGFHNKVTQPLIVGSAHPTTTTDPIIYSMQDSANVGVIQYSRGPSNAVPSPITYRQSPAAPIVLAPAATTNVLDFTGLARSICTIYYVNMGATTLLFDSFTDTVIWNGATFQIPIQSSVKTLQVVSSANILQIKNSLLVAANNVFWTLQFQRLS